MKILKKIIIAIAILIAIPFIIALFVKKDYVVEREIIINKPKKQVFNYVKHIKNQNNFSKWAMMDPNMKKDYKGIDGTVGFVYKWDGDKAGKGEQEIKSISEGERLNLELRFIKPFESIATAHMATESVSTDQTKIKWGMAGVSKYPMNFMNLFMGNVLGQDLETSLEKLKSILEK